MHKNAATHNFYPWAVVEEGVEPLPSNLLPLRRSEILEFLAS